MRTWKKVWQWVGHVSNVQWLFSLMFPALTFTAIFNCLVRVPLELSIIYGALLGLACFSVWHTMQWMKRQSQAGGVTPAPRQSGVKGLPNPTDADELKITRLPDFTLGELFSRLFKQRGFVDGGSLEDLDKVREIGRDISDEMSLRGLSTWGRIGGGTLVPLPTEISRKGFGVGRNAIGEIYDHLQYTNEAGQIVNVNDFRFLKSEIDEVWPDEPK